MHRPAAARRSSRRICASCHAIGAKDTSKLAKAPPFRDIVKKYPLENLEEAFAEGVVVNHNAPEMPEFEMEPRQIADLIDFLKTLQPRAAPAKKK